ncbi:MAG: dienelactone hydrolase family protein [Rhodospirillales bacterium]
MSGQDITIKSRDGGEFTGYLALPEGGKGPGIVVIQEIFGVNGVMRAITDEWARDGYVALCPDLFWRQEPGIQITDQSEAEWARAFELFNGFDLGKGVEDLDATIEHLRGLDGCTGKVGSVGFCLGGRLAFLTATRTNIDAAVGYYGVMLEEHVGEALRAPVLLHIATEDGFVPKENQARVHAALDPSDLATLFDYNGNDHAFARKGGKHYDEAAAILAKKRSAEFFTAHLH